MIKFLILSLVTSLILISCTRSEFPSSLENTEKGILPETSSTEFDALIPEATVTSIPATPENIEDENMEITSPISPVVTPITSGIE